MPNHSVRALAFHHERGYAAQRELAISFAGEGGRIATVEDVVNARLSSGIHHNPWTHTIITDSRAYCGYTKSGVPLMVITHGNGPTPIAQSELSFWKRLEYTNKEGEGIEQDIFESLLAGDFGDVTIVDLKAYKNASVWREGRGSNRYNFEEASKDEIVRAFFGREVDAFLERHRQANLEWTDGEHATSTNEDALVINRIYPIYKDWDRTSVPSGYASAHPLTVECAGFYRDRETKKPMPSITEFSAVTQGHHEFREAFFMVGIRGPEPLVDFAQDFRTVICDVKKHWRDFVEPLADVPADSHLGVGPDGSREKPYYLPSKWGSEPHVSTRICEDGGGSGTPEFRVIKRTIFEEPTSVDFEERRPSSSIYPYPGLWDAAVRLLPNGANAISFGGASMGGGKCDSQVEYSYVEVEPFYFLEQCGDQLFTSYAERKRPSGQPYRLVETAEKLKRSCAVNMPQQVSEMCSADYNEWPFYDYLVARAPPGANAALLNRQPLTVEYYHVTLGDLAFRPFSTLRADFDWQLDRRLKAGIL
jgi:hypothetical protein